MTKSDQAVRTFIENDNCSQAIFSTFGESLGLSRETCLNIAEAFSGGMSHSGNVCGAISGSLMVLGLKYGKAGKLSTTISAHDLGKKLMQEFEQKYGTVLCKELIKHDLSSEELIQQAQDKNVFRNCPKFVQDVAELLEELLFNY